MLRVGRIFTNITTWFLIDAGGASLYVGGFPKLGYLFGDPNNKDYSILGSILRYPNLGKLPCQRVLILFTLALPFQPRLQARRWIMEVCRYLEVRFTYNLLRHCSYNPIISRVTVVMGFTIGL